jgi:hypothetical protein
VVAPAAPGPAPFVPTPRAYEAGEFEAGPAAVLLSEFIPDAHHCSGCALGSQIAPIAPIASGDSKVKVI